MPAFLPVSLLPPGGPGAGIQARSPLAPLLSERQAGQAPPQLLSTGQAGETGPVWAHLSLCYLRSRDPKRTHVFVVQMVYNLPKLHKHLLSHLRQLKPRQVGTSNSVHTRGPSVTGRKVSSPGGTEQHGHQALWPPGHCCPRPPQVGETAHCRHLGPGGGSALCF